MVVKLLNYENNHYGWIQTLFLWILKIRILKFRLTHQICGPKCVRKKWKSGRSVESGRSRVKVDGLLTESKRSFRILTVFWQKLDGPGVKWTVYFHLNPSILSIPDWFLKIWWYSRNSTFSKLMEIKFESNQCLNKLWIHRLYYVWTNSLSQKELDIFELRNFKNQFCRD